jgi:hypothetical protein
LGWFPSRMSKDLSSPNCPASIWVISASYQGMESIKCYITVQLFVSWENYDNNYITVHVTYFIGIWRFLSGRLLSVRMRFSCPWLWRIPSFGMLRHVAVVRTDVSEERKSSIIRVTIISLLGTKLVTESRRVEISIRVKVYFSCYLLLTLFLAHWFFPPWWWSRYVLLKLLFLLKLHGVTSQKTAFFICYRRIFVTVTLA